MNESTLVPREEMSDLDWLARNVHVWKSGYDLAVVQRGGGEIYVTWPSACSCGITKEQWLARRAELQNKPSFADHPDAKCLVQMSWGGWFKNKSDVTLERRGEKATLDSCGAFEFIRSGEVLGDWRDTLEKRPEKNEMPAYSNQPKTSTYIPECAELKQFKPFVSVEDAATAKQPAPKGSGDPILGMVLADLTNRALEGKEKYGEPLLAHNGRNPLWDAYQEALDLAMYLRQAIEEQKQ